MLTPEQKAEAEKRLKMMSTEMENQKKIKDTIRSTTKKIQDNITALKNDPKAQRSYLELIAKHLGPKILGQERLTRNLQQCEEKMKKDTERINLQKSDANEDINRIKLSVAEIKETIGKIQKTVQESIEEQTKKREKIQEDIGKSIKEITDKIETFEKESAEMETENQSLRNKKKQIEEKMNSLEVDFKQKSQEKDQEIMKEKEECMAKLQELEGQVTSVTQLNKEFQAKQKQNFDKKLSLYLKTKKFPEYSTSFENSARTIDQCKEQLIKGVQRVNESKQMAEKYEKESKHLSQVYLQQLKKKVEKEKRIQAVKKEKEVVRERIINLQNKIKEKKNSSN